MQLTPAGLLVLATHFALVLAWPIPDPSSTTASTTSTSPTPSGYGGYGNYGKYGSYGDYKFKPKPRVDTTPIDDAASVEKRDGGIVEELRAMASSMITPATPTMYNDDDFDMEMSEEN
ncbi:hypothetical protein BJX99DRAFT_262463 [Aspergillus californicus]